MREYVDEAIVLAKDPNGDLDVRVALFTKHYGKLTAKAKSARKITSKLSPHLEPGNLVRVRLVEQKGMHVVDALKKEALRVPPPKLRALSELLAEGEPDDELWKLVLAGDFTWQDALAGLGWDPSVASCRACEVANPAYFEMKTQDFFCDTHAGQSPKNGLLYVKA